MEMNNEKLLALLKERAEAVSVPDSREEIKARLEVGRREKSSVGQIPERRRSASLVIKRIIPAVSALAVAAMLLIMLIPGGLLNRRGGAGISADELFSVELLALGNAVGGDGGDTALLPINTTASALGLPTLAVTREEYEAIARDIHGYLVTGDAMLFREGITSELTENTDEDHSEYKYKMKVSYTDRAGGECSYTAYYNESARVFGRSSITGVLLTSEGELPMRGQREDEGDEVELELRVMTSDDSYIAVSNEAESDESEYSYRYVENGRTVRAVSIELSREGGRDSTEIEITENGNAVSYEFEYFGSRVRCEYERNGRERELTVTVSDAEYIYAFDEGTTVVIPR